MDENKRGFIWRIADRFAKSLKEHWPEIIIQILIALIFALVFICSLDFAPEPKTGKGSSVSDIGITYHKLNPDFARNSYTEGGNADTCPGMLAFWPYDEICLIVIFTLNINPKECLKFYCLEQRG